MASHVYPLAKESFLSAGFDLTSVNLKVALLDSTYTYSAAHQFKNATNFNSASIALSGNLASKTVTAGVFNAANITITAVTTGHTIAAIAIYRDTGSDATANLVCYVDGLSQATNGGDITISWDTGSSKIFAL